MIKAGQELEKARDDRDKEIATIIENTVMSHVTPEMEEKKIAIKVLKFILKTLKQ